MGTIQNIPGKWPVIFMPPHLFGVAYGSMNAFSGLFGFAVGPPLTAFGLTGDGPTCFMIAFCSLCVGSIGGYLMVCGVPRRPPRNKYDTAATCWSDLDQARFKAT